MKQQNLRILLFNVGYGTELNGSLMDYLLHFYRYFYTPQAIINQVRQAIADLLSKTSPDLCCFVEVHRHIPLFPNVKAYSYSNFDSKYGERSILRRIPFFRDNCNGFLARNPLHYTKRFFRNGTKKMMYDIELTKTVNLLLVHLSLSNHVRKKQIQELIVLVKERPNLILCGDFNAFRGETEVERLIHECDLTAVKLPEGTFPAVHPSKKLDLFLCPRSVTIRNVQVLDTIHVSDHLPVLVDLTI